MRTTETFEQHLRKSNLSENTIHSYLWTVDFYHTHYDAVSKENLLAYKGDGVLQTQDRQLAHPGNEQVSGFSAQRSFASESRESAAEELSGECDQQC